MMSLHGPSAAQWDDLAARAGNIFGTRSWAECWWRHYGDGATPMVLADGAQPDVLIPLYRTRGPLVQVRFLGHGPADQLGPLCAPEAREHAAELLLSALRGSSSRWDVFVGQDLAEGEGWAERLGASVVRGVSSPTIVLAADSWEDFLRRRSKNFREQVRRRQRKLEQQHEVQVRLATAETLAADLATLFRLHRARWGGAAAFASGVERRFHEEFARSALADGRLRLWTMSVDGEPAGSLYGFRFAGVEYFHQSGRDPRLEELSVGTVLLTHSVRAAVEDGMQEYRMLRGDEAYKWRFADRRDAVQTVALSRTSLGRAAVGVARLKLSAPPAVAQLRARLRPAVSPAS